MTNLKKEKILELLSDWLPSEQLPSSVDQLDDSTYQKTIELIVSLSDDFRQRRIETDKYKPTDDEYDLFLNRELDHFREYEIIEYVRFHPEVVDSKWITTADQVWEEHKMEEDKAVEWFEANDPGFSAIAGLDTNVVSLDEVRNRLKSSLEKVEASEIHQSLHFISASFSQPVYLEEAGLSSREGVYAAAGGGEFKRITVSENGIPVEVELTRFGEQAAIHVRVSNPEIQDGMAVVSLLENNREIYSCLVPFSACKGKRILKEKDITYLNTITESLQVQTRLLAMPAEISRAVSLSLESIQDSTVAFSLIEPLISNRSPVIRRFAVCLLGILCGETSVKRIEDALEDSDASVRNAAKEIVSVLSHG